MLCDARCSAWTSDKDPTARLDELANDTELVKRELRRRRAITAADAAEQLRREYQEEAIRRGDVHPRGRVRKNRTLFRIERRAVREMDRDYHREKAAEAQAAGKARSKLARRNAYSPANFKD